MNRKDTLRLLALALCLLFVGASAPAESPVSVPGEAAALEAGEIDLPAVPGELPGFELAAPQDAGNDEPVETTDPPEVIVAPERTDMVFSQTLEVDTDTWTNVNLVRAKGFKAAYAKVTGQLTLENVRIGKKAARKVNLLKGFTLGPKGKIAIVDDAKYTLNLSAFSFDKGETMSLTPYRNGKKVSPKKVKWTSSKPAVASVSKRGVVTALKKGKATITATFADGSTAICYAVATNIIKAESIALSAKKLDLALNRSEKLKVAFTPAKTTFKTVKWTSSNPKVVSVDEDGVLTGMSVGKATVTAETENGKTASCDVTVAEVPLKKVDFARLYVTMHPGEITTARVVTDPANTSYPEMTYHSSDKSVVTVDASTGEMTAVGVGTATVSVKSTVNGAAKNTCKVCVIEADANRLEGVIIGINPGHQIKTVFTLYPIAPGSSKKAKGVKTGACGKWSRVPEYETNLQIGLKLKKLCEDAGAKVVITRTSNDVMLTNIERATMLNEAGVDVALQLHCNSVSNTSAHGNSGYIRTTGDWVEESRAFSKAITAAISKECGCANLGVLVYNGYMSLNWTTTPSVLLEMGYLSNRTEDRLLATDEYRQKMAQGIFNGLCEYFGRWRNEALDYPDDRSNRQ